MQSMKVNGDIVRAMRLMRNWTQEQLADACGVDVKTVQRVETTGTCGLQTRGALASTFKVSVEELTGAQPVDQQAVAQGPAAEGFAIRLTTGASVIETLDGAMAYRFSHDEATTREQADVIAEVGGQIADHVDILSDLDAGQKVESAYLFKGVLDRLDATGFWLFASRTKEKFLPNIEDRWPIANFRVVAKDNPTIITIDPKAIE